MGEEPSYSEDYSRRIAVSGPVEMPVSAIDKIVFEDWCSRENYGLVFFRFKDHSVLKLLQKTGRSYAGETRMEVYPDGHVLPGEERCYFIGGSLGGKRIEVCGQPTDYYCNAPNIATKSEPPDVVIGDVLGYVREHYVRTPGKHQSMVIYACVFGANGREKYPPGVLDAFDINPLYIARAFKDKYGEDVP